MIKVWMDFALAAARLYHEAQEVMSLRLTKLARGGTQSHSEAQLMVTEGAAYGNREGVRARRGVGYAVHRQVNAKGDTPLSTSYPHQQAPTFAAQAEVLRSIRNAPTKRLT